MLLVEIPKSNEESEVASNEQSTQSGIKSEV